MMRPLNSSKQKGFGVVAAIAILVILAALGAAIAKISSVQQVSSLSDIEGSRAYWAARAGLEWGAYQIKNTAACPATPSTLQVEGFAVTVTCYDDPGTSDKIYQVVSTAAIGTVGQLGRIERSVSAFVEF